MALVNANYKFILIDMGQYGSNADGGVFQRSEFGRRSLKHELEIPPPKSTQELVGHNTTTTTDEEEAAKAFIALATCQT